MSLPRALRQIGGLEMIGNGTGTSTGTETADADTVVALSASGKPTVPVSEVRSSHLPPLSRNR
jgi:hypothetical protein